MADPFRSVGSFLAELKRRKVYRAAVAYLLLGFGGLELVDIVVPSTRLPEWSDEFFLSLVILGFPVVMYLAWAFDVTPAGVRRSVSADAEGLPPSRHRRCRMRVLRPVPQMNLTRTGSRWPCCRSKISVKPRMQNRSLRDCTTIC